MSSEVSEIHFTEVSNLMLNHRILIIFDVSASEIMNQIVCDDSAARVRRSFVQFFLKSADDVNSVLHVDLLL